MPHRRSPFAQSLLPFVAQTLVAHRNPVTCLLCGLDRPLLVRAEGKRVEGDMLLIRPDVEHSVDIHGRAKVLYFDGLAFPLASQVASVVPRSLAALSVDALDGSAEAALELRFSLAGRGDACPAKIARIIEKIASNPMQRVSQADLARETGLERTRALRAFKAATGMTFRRYKSWTGLQYAAKQIATGALVRTAAMDAGFSDTAHLTRTFRQFFGITPTAATSDLRS
jgi:AraC-like DNA-binding protein